MRLYTSPTFPALFHEETQLETSEEREGLDHLLERGNSDDYDPQGPKKYFVASIGLISILRPKVGPLTLHCGMERSACCGLICRHQRKVKLRVLRARHRCSYTARICRQESALTSGIWSPTGGFDMAYDFTIANDLTTSTHFSTTSLGHHF